MMELGLPIIRPGPVIWGVGGGKGRLILPGSALQKYRGEVAMPCLPPERTKPTRKAEGGKVWYGEHPWYLKMFR